MISIEKQQAEADRVAALPAPNIRDIRLLGEDDGLFALALDGPDAGPLYVCAFGKEYPVEILANTFAEDGLNMGDSDSEFDSDFDEDDVNVSVTCVTESTESLSYNLSSVLWNDIRYDTIRYWGRRYNKY